MDTTNNHERLLSRECAAAYVAANYFPCSKSWLAKLASTDVCAPQYRKAGKHPLYAKRDLDAWAAKADSCHFEA